MPHLRSVALSALLSGCIVPSIDNPFTNPNNSIVVDPAVVGTGIQDIEVFDVERRTDFRDVVDVDDYGDFVVREWWSNDEGLLVNIDVFDDAFGEQQLVIALEDDEDPLIATFEVE